MTPEQQAAIERVERLLNEDPSGRYPKVLALVGDLRLLVLIAKRAVREPSGSDVERVAKAMDAKRDPYSANWDNSTSMARAAIKAWQECGELIQELAREARKALGGTDE